MASKNVSGAGRKLPSSDGIMETSDHSSRDSYSRDIGSLDEFSEDKMRKICFHLREMHTITMESFQLTRDALKCFEDNVIQMRLLKNVTQSKVDAVRKMIAAIAPVVGIPSQK